MILVCTGWASQATMGLALCLTPEDCTVWQKVLCRQTTILWSWQMLAASCKCVDTSICRHRVTRTSGCMCRVLDVVSESVWGDWATLVWCLVWWWTAPPLCVMFVSPWNWQWGVCVINKTSNSASSVVMFAHRLFHSKTYHFGVPSERACHCRGLQTWWTVWLEYCTGGAFVWTKVISLSWGQTWTANLCVDNPGVPSRAWETHCLATGRRSCYEWKTCLQAQFVRVYLERASLQNT